MNFLRKKFSRKICNEPTYNIIEMEVSKKSDEGFGKPKRKPSLLDFLVVAICEFIGSAILIFLSCAGNTLGIQEDRISSLHLSLNAGLAVTVAIQIFGHLSGAYVNPCVTLSAYIMNEIGWVHIPVYIVAQIAGSLAGSALHLGVTPSEHLGIRNGTGVCVTTPDESLTEVQGFAMETILSMIMNFAICASWDSRNSDKLDSISLRIGLVVAVLNLAAGAYTGASMNPVRSFGPSVWTGDFTAHWIYWVGPTLGAVVAAVCYRYIFLTDHTRSN